MSDTRARPITVGHKSQPLPEVPSLRDQFAMVAAEMFAGEIVRSASRAGAVKQVAKAAYLFADAMMEARK